MGVMFFIGLIAGIVLAVAITMFIMVSIVKKSNDWGDYDSAEDTMTEFAMINKADKVKEPFSKYEKS